MADAIKPPLELIGTQGTSIWKDHHIVASLENSRTQPRVARATAERMVMAYNCFDDLYALYAATVELDKVVCNDASTFEAYEAANAQYDLARHAATLRINVELIKFDVSVRNPLI